MTATMIVAASPLDLALRQLECASYQKHKHDMDQDHKFTVLEPLSEEEDVRLSSAFSADHLAIIGGYAGSWSSQQSRNQIAHGGPEATPDLIDGRPGVLIGQGPPRWPFANDGPASPQAQDRPNTDLPTPADDSCFQTRLCGREESSEH